MLMKKRVVLIDMDDQFIQMVKYILGSIEKVVIVNMYEDCTDALANFEKDQPDIIIMDLDFKSRKGPEFIPKVKKLNHRVDILVITDYLEEDIILNVIGAGASGFLLKQNCLPVLPEAIKSIARGGSPLDPIVARVIINAHQAGGHSPLTIKETAVLKLMMNGLTYTMIAEELGIAKETSKTHIKNIYKKLNVNSRAAAVSKAITEKLVPSNIISSYIS